ncbi:UNVERIFIED_CONTAM: hypothetical protein FKN15_039968 [Acipenser sinensis]
MAGLLTAYLDSIFQSVPLPEPVATGLPRARYGPKPGRPYDGVQTALAVPGQGPGYRPALLDAPISPGHTFGPAVEEILQHSHREQEASRQVALMLPSHASVRERMRCWRPPVKQTMTRMVLIPTVPRSDLKHHLQASAAANNRG